MNDFPARTGAVTEECGCGGLLDKNVILALIVWLLLLTILIIVLLVLMTRRHSDHYSSSRKTESYRAGPKEAPWLDALREDQWKEYTVETISNAPR